MKAEGDAHGRLRVESRGSAGPTRSAGTIRRSRHWLVSAVVGTLALAGVAGRIVAGTRLGFVQGVIFGALFLIGVVLLCFLLLLTGLPWLLWPHGSWLLFVVLLVVGIAVLVGGGVGGFTVRPRSER